MQSATERTACRGDLEAVQERLEAHEAEYAARAGEAEFATALQSARVVEQWEAVESDLMTRDAAMAENVLWLLEQLGPDGSAIGCCYGPADPQAFWSSTTIRDDYDVIIHFDSTTPSRLRPFRYPEHF